MDVSSCKRRSNNPSLKRILGVRELVLDDPTPFSRLAITRHGKSINYEAKAVALAGRRYIVCRNHDEAKKDVADRATILAALEWQLRKGDKASRPQQGGIVARNPRRLSPLIETEVEQDNERFLLRSAPRPAASLALRAVGVALPPSIRQVAEV